MTDKTSELQSLIRELFADKVDSVGMPYYFHLERVAYQSALLAPEYGFNERVAYIVGLCHDCFEDLDDDKINRLKQHLIASMPYCYKTIIDVIQLVTHDKGVAYKDYLQHIIDIGGVGLVVKYCDLVDNSDISRYKTVDDRIRSRCEMYAKRARKCYRALNQERTDESN